MSSIQDKFGTGNRQIAEIIPDFLYLSDIGCASDDALLTEAGFTHVISVLSAPIPWLGPSSNSACRILHIRCDDGEEEDILSHFETTNAFIEEALRENQALDSALSSPCSPASLNSLASSSGSTSSSFSSPISPLSPRTPSTPGSPNSLNSNSSGNGKRNKVLCHCLAGISRSPTIIAAYLLTLGMKSEEALDLLREKRTVVEPNRGFIEQLAMYEARVRSRPQSRLPSPPNSPHSPTPLNSNSNSNSESQAQSQAPAQLQAPLILQPRAPAPLSLHTHLTSLQSQPQPPSPTQSPSASQSQSQSSQCPLQLHPQPMRSRASLSIQPIHRNTATNTTTLSFPSAPARMQPSLITQKTLFVG